MNQYKNRVTIDKKTLENFDYIFYSNKFTKINDYHNKLSIQDFFIT